MCCSPDRLRSPLLRGREIRRSGDVVNIASRSFPLSISPLRFFRNLGRTREIVTVLLNHGFGDVVERLRLLNYLRWWRRVVLRKPEVLPALTVYQRIRMALEELGP